MWTLLPAIIIWSATGVIISLLYRRQGHNLLVYAGLGVWLGPLILMIMGSVAREQETPVDLIRVGEDRDGWIDVLVGIDDTDESAESVLRVIDRIGPAIRRLRIATSLDPETANSRSHFTTDEELRSRLEYVAEMTGPSVTDIAFVTGRADRSLVRHAVEEGFDFLVVSHRHHSLLGVLFGSTVQRLTRTATIPIIIGPPVTPGRQDAHRRQLAAEFAGSSIHKGAEA